MRNRFNRHIVNTLIVCLLAGAPLAPAQAGIIGTEQAIATSERADALARVNSVLMSEDVRAQFEALGVDADDALARVDALTDSELAQLQAQLDELPAGGSVLGVLGVVLVVLLVLELLGVTNVFTGI